MKEFFNIQLFAEDTPADTADTKDTKPAAGKDEKVDKPDTAPAADRSTPKYSDDELDAIVEKKFAKWQKQQQKAVDEAKKLAEMNAQQKAEYERDELRKEVDAYKRKDALAEMSKTARKMLSDSGITINDELLSMMVTTDAKETKAAVDGFAKAFNDAVEKAVKERLKGEPPKKGSGGAAPMTKAQIMAIRDPELRQQKMLEHRELFNI